jgi:hypothetical protein
MFVVEDRDPASDQFGLTICFALFPKGQYSVKVRDVRSVAPLDKGYDDARIPGDLFLMTGGFWAYVNERQVPEGLVISDGVVRSSLAFGGQGGIAASNGHGFSIFPTGSATIDQSTEAVQSKPLLVRDGALDVRGDDLRRSDRTAIALDLSGSVMVAGAFRGGAALSLLEWAAALISCGAMRGVSLKTALNLDGGPAAHLYAPSLRLHLGAHHTYFLNNVVVIRGLPKN